jgi:hypothetical protein
MRFFITLPMPDEEAELVPGSDVERVIDFHFTRPFITKQKTLPPLRDEELLRGATPITFNLRTSLECCNGLSRRWLLDSPAQSLWRAAGEFNLSGAPAGAMKGFHLTLPSR